MRPQRGKYMCQQLSVRFELGSMEVLKSDTLIPWLHQLTVSHPTGSMLCLEGTHTGVYLCMFLMSFGRNKEHFAGYNLVYFQLFYFLRRCSCSVLKLYP